MKVWLAHSFLPLLLFTWLPSAGLTQQISATIDPSLQLELVLQCLLQAGSGSTTGEVKWLNTTRNNGEKQNEGDVKKTFAQLIFTGVNTTDTGTYTCRMKNTSTVPEDGQTLKSTNRKGTALHSQVSQTGFTHWSDFYERQHYSGTNPRTERQKPKTDSHTREPVITVECRFRIWLENITVHVQWYKTACLEMGNPTDTTALGENCTSLTSSSVHAADVGICGCRVFITRINLTDTGNGTQGTGPNYGPGAPQINGTKKDTWTGLNFLLCIMFGLVVGTLLYMPIIAFLLWQCRRNRKGKLTSSQVTEGNQLRMTAPVTGTEDLTYANLKFEKKGTNPIASGVVYSEIKPSQQKQSSGSASAANTGVDVFP
ncbi:uncharacterized protein [Phaenicophaeus curvirostris]|uniref:uncharacterized protein isoform X1 n=1 Tax=Phaenicophaeus curvirostris TaxID=33595 RepID=UPI0037F0CF15